MTVCHSCAKRQCCASERRSRRRCRALPVLASWLLLPRIVSSSRTGSNYEVEGVEDDEMWHEEVSPCLTSVRSDVRVPHNGTRKLIAKGATPPSSAAHTVLSPCDWAPAPEHSLHAGSVPSSALAMKEGIMTTHFNSVESSKALWLALPVGLIFGAICARLLSCCFFVESSDDALDDDDDNKSESSTSSRPHGKSVHFVPESGSNGATDTDTAMDSDEDESEANETATKFKERAAALSMILEVSKSQEACTPASVRSRRGAALSDSESSSAESSEDRYELHSCPDRLAGKASAGDSPKNADSGACKTSRTL